MQNKHYLNVKNTQNEHLVKMCKCRVAICDYKILSPEGFTHFLCTTRSYIDLGPVQKKTGPDQSQDCAGLIKTGPKWSSPGLSIF